MGAEREEKGRVIFPWCKVHLEYLLHIKHKVVAIAFKAFMAYRFPSYLSQIIEISALASASYTSLHCPFVKFSNKDLPAFSDAAHQAWEKLPNNIH